VFSFYFWVIGGQAFNIHSHRLGGASKRVITIYLLNQKRIVFVPKHHTGVSQACTERSRSMVSEVGFRKVYCGSIHNNPSFVKVNPCGGVVDDYKVGENHLTLPSLQGEGAVAVRLLLWVQHFVDKEKIYNRVGSSSLLLEEKGGGMRCFPSFVKVNPCRSVVDDYKVGNKIGTFG
jgi:hypothetical protein